MCNLLAREDARAERYNPCFVCPVTGGEVTPSRRQKPHAVCLLLLTALKRHFRSSRTRGALRIRHSFQRRILPYPNGDTAISVVYPRSLRQCAVPHTPSSPDSFWSVSGDLGSVVSGARDIRRECKRRDRNSPVPGSPYGTWVGGFPRPYLGLSKGLCGCLSLVEPRAY